MHGVRFPWLHAVCGSPGYAWCAVPLVMHGVRFPWLHAVCGSPGYARCAVPLVTRSVNGSPGYTQCAVPLVTRGVRFPWLHAVCGSPSYARCTVPLVMRDVRFPWLHAVPLVTDRVHTRALYQKQDYSFRWIILRSQVILLCDWVPEQVRDCVTPDLCPVLPAGEQPEPGGCGTDVPEEPHPEIHPASPALPPAAPSVRGGHCQP